MFYGDPIIDLLNRIMQGQSGFPVGNPISPVLSNLYLLNFDNFIAQNELRMVRFSDDFIIFGKAGRLSSEVEQLINNRLAVDHLRLNTEKTVHYSEGQEIEFLGYKITKSNLIKQIVKTQKPISTWLPLFEYNYKHTKTVYITFNTISARTHGNNLLIQTRESNRQIPWSDIHRIVIIGRSRISGGAIRKAMFKQIPIVFLTITGKQIGNFTPCQIIKNINNDFNSDFISVSSFKKNFMVNTIKQKIDNQYNILKKFKITEPQLLSYKEAISVKLSKKQIFGFEGISSVLFFEHFRKLCNPFPFEKRIYHPPEGPVNVMLSFGYSLLYYRIAEILKAHYLNPFDGILHQSRGRHMALASDFLENFRFIAEKVTLNLINLKMVKLDDFVNFEYKSKNFTKMTDNGFKKFIHRFEKTMMNEIKNEFDKQITMEQILNENIKKYIRCLHLGIQYSPINLFRR